MKQLYNFSKILKDLRQANKFSKGYVARQLGITFQSYHAYELGKTVPTLQNFIKLAELFDVSTDYLLGRDADI